MQQDKAYLSVYSDFNQTASGNWQVNYHSRLLGSSVTQPIINKQLAVQHHVNTALVQVWFYDTSIDPLSWEVNVTDIVELDWNQVLQKD